ncbi:glycosyltransferase family 4 protein [Halorubrum ezzemoulense]|nr:glycosyltransferase family 4 protein [Halorubrum ezzemoulense]
MASHMKIVHFYDGHEKTYRGRGSVPTVVWNIAKGVSDIGHDVSIIERKWDKLSSKTIKDGVNFHRLNLSIGSDEPWIDIPYEMVGTLKGTIRLIFSRLEFALKIKPILERLDPDIIHCHLPFAANLITLFFPKFRHKIIYTAHLGETNKRVTEPMFSPDVFLAKRSSITTVLNEKMKGAFEESGVDEQKLRIVPNGVDIDQFMSKKDYNNEKPLVLFVGTVTPRKRVIDLVEAASRTKDIDSKFIIAGKTDIDEEYYSKVKQKILKYGLEDRFEFTGFVSNEHIQKLYSKADIFVLPSQEEGFGMVVTEAMAAETPVIGTHVGGIPLQINNGVNGFLYDPGDVNALSSSLRELLLNPSMRRKLGERGRAIAVQNFSWESISRKFENIYQEISDSTE